jgi:DNA-binding NarL/FixJ family response regulator
MQHVKLLIADDHKIVTEALASLLKESFELVGTVHNGYALIEAALRLKPDIIVSDVFMPYLNGLDALRQLRTKGLNTKVIFLTMYANAELAAEAFHAGASGFVSKESAGEELMQAITEALSGRDYVTPLIGKDVLTLMMDSKNASFSSGPQLSRRQREILQLIAEGKSIKESAAILGISPRTAETHKYELMRILDTQTTAELIRWAIRFRLVPIE